MPIIKKSTSITGKKLVILAPVPESFLRTAVWQIFPTCKKVSFGANKANEMGTIRQQFLTATEYQGDVYVYIYAGGIAQYKAALLDEFLFYSETTPHPQPWGSWNINFKSYYTVKNIEECNIPLSKFRSYLTGKVIVNVRRPLRVIDPQ